MEGLVERRKEGIGNSFHRRSMSVAMGGEGEGVFSRRLLACLLPGTMPGYCWRRKEEVEKGLESEAAVAAPAPADVLMSTSLLR